MAGCVQPHTHVLLRLQSDILKVVEVIPNSSITLPKVGIIPTNLLLGRPFFYTYELVDHPQGDEATTEDADATATPTSISTPAEAANATTGRQKHKNRHKSKQANRTCHSLRIVPAAELHWEALAGKEDNSGNDNSNGTPVADLDDRPEGSPSTAVSSCPMTPFESKRNNRLIVDDASRQQLSMEEIEALKETDKASGKDIIEKIKQSHRGLDEKTEFSLAKYTLRKEKKYLKRFTVLPLDPASLAEYLMDKEASKIMEIRRESLALITSWANVRWSDSSTWPSSPSAKAEPEDTLDDSTPSEPTDSHGRWLVIDDTGGLIIAALAEKMGILHEPNVDSFSDSDSDSDDESHSNSGLETRTETTESVVSQSTRQGAKSKPPEPMTARTNTITVLHPNHQPNIGLLQFFGFNANAPSPTHPLYSHLHTLSWLQLLHPHADAGYVEPAELSPAEISELKSNRRSTYFRKRRRWARIRSVVDAVRAGGFDGLVVATTMGLAQVLRSTVPLLKGGARVVIFSPSIEPLSAVADMCSKERKTAWLGKLDQILAQPDAENHNGEVNKSPTTTTNGLPVETRLEKAKKQLETEFGLDPTILLAPSIQTSRARAWQVLPSRTHPLMTSRGGPEGYILTSTRVLAHQGKVEAKGVYTKRRRVE